MTSDQAELQEYSSADQKQWEYKQLGDIAHINLGQSPKGEYYNEVGEGPHFIQGSKNFGNKYPKLERYCSEPKRVAEEGDVLISVRAPVGPVNIAPEELCIGRGVTALSLNEGTNEFLYYYLKYFEDKWSQYADGTTFNSITKSDLQELEIPYPPIEERNKISEILSNIDEKIEVNKEIVNELEDFSRILFRNQLIDFEEFEGDLEFDEDFDKKIPITWEKKSLDGIAHFLNGKAWQQFESSEKENDLPVIKIKELREGITEDSDRVAKSDCPEDYIVEDGRVIFSWSASLVLDIWTEGLGFLNQHLFKVTSEEYPRWFFYEWINYHIRRFRNIADAKKTTMGHIKRSDLKEAKVLVPPEEELNSLSAKFNPVFETIVEKRIENRYLLDLRDTLLPKLMTGEIRVNDISLDDLEVDSEV